MCVYCGRYRKSSHEHSLKKSVRHCTVNSRLHPLVEQRGSRVEVTGSFSIVGRIELCVRVPAEQTADVGRVRGETRKSLKNTIRRESAFMSTLRRAPRDPSA